MLPPRKDTMNPIMSMLAQIIILMPANLALRLLDRVIPLAAGQLPTDGHRGELLVCSLFVTGWWTLIVQTVFGITGLP